MSSKSREQKIFLKEHPDIKRWLNQCIICGTTGYKPELPETIFPGLLAENIRKLFKPLSVDDLNICEQCGKYLT